MSPFGTRLVVGAAAAMAAAATCIACGGSTDSDGSGTGGGAGTGATAGSGGAGGAGGSSGTGAVAGGGGTGGFCESLVPCCDAAGNPVDPICPSGTPECPPGSTWPTGGTCEPTTGACSPSVPCSASEYCDYPDDRCGQGSEGVCKPRPTACDLIYAPVCGCDGQVAGNECSAQAAGTDVSALGGCTPPQGTFACGTVFCAQGSQYCQRAVSDVGGYPDGFSCHPLPSGCGATPSCACLANEPCGSWCEASGSGDLTVTCPGG